MDHLWYFVSGDEPDGPSGHVVVCPAPEPGCRSRPPHEPAG